MDEPGLELESWHLPTDPLTRRDLSLTHPEYSSQARPLAKHPPVGGFSPFSLCLAPCSPVLEIACACRFAVVVNKGGTDLPECQLLSKSNVWPCVCICLYVCMYVCASMCVPVPSLTVGAPPASEMPHLSNELHPFFPPLPLLFGLAPSSVQLCPVLVVSVGDPAGAALAQNMARLCATFLHPLSVGDGTSCSFLQALILSASFTCHRGPSSVSQKRPSHPPSLPPRFSFKSRVFMLFLARGIYPLSLGRGPQHCQMPSKLPAAQCPWRTVRAGSPVCWHVPMLVLQMRLSGLILPP